MYVPWHAAFVDVGYAVLIFDYRGFGGSDGERGWILRERMVEDMCNQPREPFSPLGGHINAGIARGVAERRAGK